MVFNENTNYDFILLSKQGRTQLIYSTEHVFENFGAECPVALPWLPCQLARHVSITCKQELQKSGISFKAINETLLHKPDN